VKLNVVVRAPLLIVPYTPAASLSPALSPLSPPASPPLRAFVANLGELSVKNVFKLASEGTTGEGKETESSRFLSPLGFPAVVDCMTLNISSVQLGRVLDVEKAGIERSSSGDIHAEPRNLEANSHALLWPLQFKGQITRRLSDWCTTVPSISISCELQRIQMQFSPLDYQDMMCVLQDIKHMSSGHTGEESTSELVAVAKPESQIEPAATHEGKVTEAEGSEKKEGKDSPSDAVSVHVEAAMESLELVLYSHMGEVAEVKIKGVAASVDMHNYGISVKAGISGVEVLDCTPGVLYHKIVSVEEERSAVEAKVKYYFNGTKGGGSYDTSKWDLSVHLRVNRIRVVALYLFVARVLDYAQQLHVQESHLEVFEPEGVPSETAIASSQPVVQESAPVVAMRMKLDISVQAPEITVPLGSQSHDIVVLDLGQLTLRNELLTVSVGFSEEMNVALYEQYDVKLIQLQMYRSVWDKGGNKPSACQRSLLEPVVLSVEVERNLSAQWFHGMPTLSIDAKLEPLLVNFSSVHGYTFYDCVCTRYVPM
jgi:hypothetical protein